VALTSCRIRRLSRRRFDALVASDLRVSAWTMRMLARDLQQQARMRQMFGAGAEARLLWQLAALARVGVTRVGGGWRIDFVPTHERLGQLIGVSREKVTRLLGGLRARGVIASAGRQYVMPPGSPLLDSIPASTDDV
jgi:CRP-like cAMP-binding protein